MPKPSKNLPRLLKTIPIPQIPLKTVTQKSPLIKLQPKLDIFLTICPSFLSRHVWSQVHLLKKCPRKFRNTSINLRRHLPSPNIVPYTRSEISTKTRVLQPDTLCP